MGFYLCIKLCSNGKLALVIWQNSLQDGEDVLWTRSEPIGAEADVCVWQEFVEGRVALWVALAHPIWQEVDVQAPDAMQQATQHVAASVDVLLKRARMDGFPANQLPSGMPHNY